MSRRDALNSLFLGKPAQASPATSPAKNPERVRTGAIGAMGTSLQELTQGARAAARLHEQLLASDHVVALDVSLIDPSPIADRLPADLDPGFDQLVASIEQNGQQVPILVRPSPSVEGRYQIAYGRRRLRALVQLGQPVKAIVRELSDDEVVVAQGRENLDRADLSFIERALFAKRLEDAGYERSVIMSALSTDKADLSRYIAIARRVPEELAKQIGPAVKAGRARWSALVEALAKPKAAAKVDDMLASDQFRSADSDTRFTLVFGAVAPSVERSVKGETWSTPEGRRAARVERRGTQTAITFDEKRVPEFAAFVAERLDALYAEFANEQGGNKPEH
ncbi:plasmid partitioning protein RepB [Pseudorhodoplanes sp.]|uniref:plasmid partitioning protein RepB n=1 Tax=Pseudorhodoplanes sp. TaxID=1934341 RepID=UPI003D11C053